jgi:hypothetical protein
MRLGSSRQQGKVVLSSTAPPFLDYTFFDANIALLVLPVVSDESPLWRKKIIHKSNRAQAHNNYLTH